MRRRQQGLAPIKVPEQYATPSRLPERLSKPELEAEQHFAETKYQDIPGELRDRVEKVVDALKGTHDSEAIRQSARSAFAAGGEESLHDLLEIQEERLNPPKATSEKLSLAKEELYQANKEFQDEVERAYRVSQRRGLIEEAIRRRVERGIQKSLEDAQATAPREGDAGPAREPAAPARPAQTGGASAAEQPAGALAPADRGQTARDNLAKARAAKGQTLLSIIKRAGGFSRESAIAHFGNKETEELEKAKPSIFLGSYQELNAKGKMVTRTRAGTMPWIEAAEHLIGEGHMLGDKTDSKLHELLRDKILAETLSLEHNNDRAMARELAAHDQEMEDARRHHAAAAVAKAVREGTDLGQAEGHESEVGEVPKGAEQAHEAAPPKTGHLNERGEYVDSDGTVRFFIPPGGRVPRTPSGQPPGGGQPPGQPAAPAGGGRRGPEPGLIDDIKKLLAPATRGPDAETGGGIIRQNLAEQARSNARAEAALEATSAHFDKTILGAPDEATRNDRFLQFMDAMQHGRIDTLPEDLKAFAQVARSHIDQAERTLLDRGILQNTIDNYVGQLWKKRGSDLAPEEIARIFHARRPLAGSEGFKKQRFYEDYRAGIDAGLEPVTWNPAQLILLKLREVNKSIMGHGVFDELKEKGLAPFVRLGGKAPEGFTKISDKLATVFAPASVDLKEYYDKRQMDGLERFAQSMGFKINTTMRGEPGSSTQGGDVTRRFGTPEEVLIHEIGHQIDDRYHLSTWANDPSLKGELEHLADMRASGQQHPAYQQYIKSPSEMVANLFAGYLHAPELTKQVAPHAFEKLDQFLQSKPELAPLRDVKPSLELGQREQAMRLAGPMLTGHYMMPEPVSRLLDNYLQPGLRGNRAYDAVKGFGDILNQFQLGFSAFHAGFVAMDTQVSAMALGFQQISRGEFAKGAKSMIGAPLAPFRSFMEGSKVLKEYYAPGSQGAETAAIVDSLIKAGGRAKMDAFYNSSYLAKFQSALREGRYVGALGNSIGAVAEFVSKPIMEGLVPRMKLGVFADMARAEMARGNGDSRAVLGKAWDSVENRLGQMTYDNIFWNKVFKDTMMAGVRSVGWNLGTWRELGGGVKDLPSSIHGTITGEGVSPRVGYLIALPMITAIYGSMYQYLATGKGPDEMKDLFFPKNGRTRKDGTADRVSLPSYMRDVASLFNRADEGPLRIAQNAWTMAKHKVHPALAIVGEMLSNEDYYGAAIVNPNDPATRQALDVAKHLGGAFTPFAARGFQQQRASGASMGQAAQSFIGITPAPGYITQTSEQQRQRESGRRFQLTPLEQRRRMGLR